MKRLPCILFVIFFALFVFILPQTEALLRNDGNPSGGTLNYGEYGRPLIFDPITSNDMISLRITELLFNGLVGIDENLASQRRGGTKTIYSRRCHIYLSYHDAP